MVDAAEWSGGGSGLSLCRASFSEMKCEMWIIRTRARSHARGSVWRHTRGSMLMKAPWQTAVSVVRFFEHDSRQRVFLHGTEERLNRLKLEKM